MITPCLKMNPSVVVPWFGLTISTTSRSNESICGKCSSHAHQVMQHVVADAGWRMLGGVRKHACLAGCAAL